jgi:hypothetical protein
LREHGSPDRATPYRRRLRRRKRPSSRRRGSSCPEKLGQLNFIREVLINSQTQVLVISGVPNGLIQGPELMFRTRDLINELAGSRRAITQAMIDPKRAPGLATSLDSMERQVVTLGAKALECYTYNGNWRRA